MSATSCGHLVGTERLQDNQYSVRINFTVGNEGYCFGVTFKPFSITTASWQTTIRRTLLTLLYACLGGWRA